MDINKIMAKLLNSNKKVINEEYKNAYCDGVLDFYNKIKGSEVSE